MNDEVKVTEMPERDISVGKNAECRAFVGNGRDTIGLEKVNEAKEFGGEDKISNHVDTILIAKLFQDTFWHGFNMGLLEIPIEEWHDPMSPRRSYEIGPVDIVLGQFVNPTYLFIATKQSGTVQK
jgi:hypothetical protein